MRLLHEQLVRILERGIRVTSACDKCGRLLGAIRWTIRGQVGEWCSAICRDGAKKTCRECGVGLTGKRADSEFCGEAHSKRYRRRVQSQTRQNCGISPDRPIGKQGLTEAQNASWGDALTGQPQRLEMATARETRFS
jgi:hypothetical protein